MKDSYNIENNKLIEDSLLNNKHIILDGNRVILGKESHILYKYKINKYRSLLEVICKVKQNELSSSEFIINLLHNPILNIKDRKMINPFEKILKDEAKPISIDGNILPILSETECNGYLDIAIPTTIDWEYVNDNYLLDMCGENLPIPTDTKSLINFISP